ncbi:MAG: BLUF domain-containing protein [Maribacter sp.]
MHQLTYTSMARPDISSKEISDILAVAQANNQRSEITGCLVFHKGVFVQIIEGVREGVFAMYDKIQTDARHLNVSLVWEGSCLERIFPTWEMAFYNHSSNPLESASQFEKNLLLLADFSGKPTAAAGLFWLNVKKALTKSISASDDVGRLMVTG